MDDYGVSPSDLAQDEEMMRALGLYKSIVMLENTAAFVIKVLYVRCPSSSTDVTQLPQPLPTSEQSQ
jgi:hypothetical protein